MELRISAIAEHISEQLKVQNIRFDKAAVDQFQKDANAISRLYIRGLITLNQSTVAKNKLYKNILKHITSYKKK